MRGRSAHVQTEGDFVEADGQRPCSVSGHKRKPISVESLMRKRVAALDDGPANADGTEYLRLEEIQDLSLCMDLLTKKAELRERKLMNKYNELKEARKLDAFIERRHRKNASKDHWYMPYRRNGDGA